jgi:hypothetical protein
MRHRIAIDPQSDFLGETVAGAENRKFARLAAGFFVIAVEFGHHSGNGPFLR